LSEIMPQNKGLVNQGGSEGEGFHKNEFVILYREGFLSDMRNPPRSWFKGGQF
jgi:hypothetical protein